jgi:aspartate/methionine/tyrosine aminotransferase
MCGGKEDWKAMSSPSEDVTLTSLEAASLPHRLNFADGHAYHRLTGECERVVEELPMLWREAARCSILEMGQRFRDQYASAARLKGLVGYPHFNICYSASNSIDIVAAFVATLGLKAGLITPCFDNLALLLRRRGVEPHPIHEADAFDPNSLHRHICTHGLRVVFLVSPNNPTGTRPSEDAFRGIVRNCVELGVLLVLDQCFRFFHDCDYDEYSILIDSNVDFIVIEDTGKAWPTQDMKASMLNTSANIASHVREIYHETLLCVSNFSLAVLCRVLALAGGPTSKKMVFDEVAWRRASLRDALAHTPLSIAHESETSVLGVEWIDCTGIGLDDMGTAELLSRNGIHILPGRYFYWDSPTSCSRVRWSLLRPEGSLLEGIELLRSMFNEKVGLSSRRRDRSHA